MKILRRFLLTFSILSGLMVALEFVMPHLLGWFMGMRIDGQAGSVGIIGGADGPTAIFVASSTVPWATVIEIVLCVGCFAAWLVLHLKARRK